MAKAIGLDLSERGFKIVEAEGSAKKIKVTRIISRTVDPSADGTLDRVIDELRATLRDEKIPRESVVASISARDAILRSITVPFQSPDQIRKVIRFEAESHIQHCTIDDVVIEHHKACDIGDKSEVLVFGVTKDALAALIKDLGRCGIDPVAIDIDPLATYCAVTLTEAPETYRRLAVLEIGACNTSLLILEDGHLVAARCLRLGSGSIDHAIGRDLQIPVAEAETKKLELLAVSHGGSGGVDLLPAVNLTEDHVLLEDESDDKPEIEKSPDELETELIRRSRDDFLAKLHREIVRTLASSHAGSHRLDAILLAGGGSQTPGLVPYLEENFAPTVRIFNPLEEIGTDLSPEEIEEHGVKLLVPLGLAAKCLGHDPLSTDFRQEEFRYLKRFDQIKVALASCTSLVLILFCFMGAYFWKQLAAAKIPYERLVHRSEEVFLETKEDDTRPLPEGRFERIGKIKNRMSYQNVDLENQLGKSKDFAPVKSAVDPLLAILNDVLSVEKEISGIIIDIIDVKTTKIKITGWVPEAKHLDVLIDAMELSTEKHGLYKEITAGSTTNSPSGLLRFDKFEIIRPGD